VLSANAGMPRYTLEITAHTDRCYFSVTGFVRDHRGREQMGGCIHNVILANAPEYAPLIALHLSDVETGEPLYAVDNGYYLAAGALGGLDRAFHAGNEDPPRTPAECQDALAKLFRIDRILASGILYAIRTAYDISPKLAKATFAAQVDALRPQWEAEAAAGRALLAGSIPRVQTIKCTEF